MKAGKRQCSNLQSPRSRPNRRPHLSSLLKSRARAIADTMSLSAEMRSPSKATPEDELNLRFVVYVVPASAQSDPRDPGSVMTVSMNWLHAMNKENGLDVKVEGVSQSPLYASSLPREERMRARRVNVNKAVCDVHFLCLVAAGVHYLQVQVVERKFREILATVGFRREGLARCVDTFSGRVLRGHHLGEIGQEPKKLPPTAVEAVAGFLHFLARAENFPFKR